MVLKSILTVSACTLLLAASPALANGYQPNDFLKLDLSRAALSPDPLGPPAHFEQVPVEASAPDSAEVTGVKTVQAQHAHVRNPRHAVRAKPTIAHPKLVRRSHGNPLDAQAFDTRIQVWPCKSGGICNWRRSR
ncbi:MAG: hypothetical protein JSS22_09740 [Proteobacteria bacterium]|nr:hypothetical protein [Pseudomonadota bacterium]